VKVIAPAQRNPAANALQRYPFAESVLRQATKELIKLSSQLADLIDDSAQAQPGLPLR
jgi:hypothetical protein